MSDKTLESKIEKPNKYKVGPGLGLIILGAAYLIWWLVFIEYAIMDHRWAHNFAYAIIIFNVGLAWSVVITLMNHNPQELSLSFNHLCCQ